MKNKLPKEELLRQLALANKKEEREMRDLYFPKFKKLEGTCYKTRNSFGGNRRPWWLYIKILSIKRNDLYLSYGKDKQVLSYYSGVSFEACSDGSIRIENRRTGYVHSLDKRISESEFNKAKRQMFREATSRLFFGKK